MGLASSNLLEEENPFSPINRRISILVMSREAEARLSGAGRTPLTPKVAPVTAAPLKP
jgi:chemotaxis protein MotB